MAMDDTTKVSEKEQEVADTIQKASATMKGYQDQLDALRKDSRPGDKLDPPGTTTPLSFYNIKLRNELNQKLEDTRNAVSGDVNRSAASLNKEEKERVFRKLSKTLNPGQTTLEDIKSQKANINQSSDLALKLRYNKGGVNRSVHGEKMRENNAQVTKRNYSQQFVQSLNYSKQAGKTADQPEKSNPSLGEKFAKNRKDITQDKD